jgi:hypothetical protein
LINRKALALFAFLPFVLFGAAFPLAFGGQQAPDGQQVAIKSLVIPEFKSGGGKRYGDLEYLGGLAMASKNGEMGAVSSIRMLPDGKSFVSVMDTGHWAEGKIERGADGRLSGIADYRIYTMRDDQGVFSNDKENLDAEGMLIAGNHLYVSFERVHRIAAYPFPGFETSKPDSVQKPVIKGYRLQGNGGIEALLKAPDGGAFQGALFYVAERSYNKDGNFIAGVQSGPKKGMFFVKRSNAYDVTDGKVLADGSFLLLERKFSLTDGIGMRIRRFKLADIAPGATIDGTLVMEADFSHQIDNMEGLDTFTAADGSTHLILTSDDNHSLLERNLMLEFKLLK